MKLMIASDIHGSALYCSRMLEAFDREGRTAFFCWGTSFITAPAMISRRDTPLRK